MEQDLRPYVSKLSGDPKVDYDALLREIGDAQVVMIGGATHGTHEFCEERDKITKRLIEEKGFSQVFCEADWPDMERVHRYVRGLKGDRSAVEALAGFQRFPNWMWKNQVMVDFVEWAKKYNEKVFAKETNTHPLAIYGIDLHSLFDSIDRVIEYLEKVDPSAARRARERYSCLDEFRRDPASYGFAAGQAYCKTCEKEVLEVLLDVLKTAPKDLGCDGNQRDYRCCEDLSFYAIQNALVVKDAEAYYRAMFKGGDVSAWNIRDRHMFDVIVALMEHSEKTCGFVSKVVVWAHNCHISDARTSEVSWWWKEINVGQLVKETFGDKAFSIGMTTYSGYLTSAPYWGGPARRMRLKPAVEDSFCHLLHEVSEPRFMLGGAKDRLRDLQCLKRSIGVIYRPETERESHYFEAKVVQQFDEYIYLDQTTALEPLDGKDEWASDADGPEHPDT